MIFSFPIHLLLPLSINVDLVMFLILTTEVLMAYATLKESELFQSFFFLKIYVIFWEVFVNLY